MEREGDLFAIINREFWLKFPHSELQNFDYQVSVATVHNRMESMVAQAQIGTQFYLLVEAVEQARKETPRASSLVENFNSRLRNYFFLRRQLGNNYLDLLRFFLNHRTFLRTEHPEREGKSPAELLTGESHPHWLELLGFDLFRRPATVV